MGNRALIGALKRLGEAREPLPKLANVILAAADEERQIFEDMLPKLLPGASADPGKAVSVYCAVNDRALNASKIWHFGSRLGETISLEGSKQQILVEDVLDATHLKRNWKELHHSYYGDIEAVIRDIEALIKDGKRAKQRAGEKLVELPYSNTTRLVYEFRP
jgi:esterase/lipase superfamily enzyme